MRKTCEREEAGGSAEESDVEKEEVRAHPEDAVVAARGVRDGSASRSRSPSWRKRTYRHLCE